MNRYLRPVEFQIAASSLSLREVTVSYSSCRSIQQAVESAQHDRLRAFSRARQHESDSKVPEKVCRNKEKECESVQASI